MNPRFMYSLAEILIERAGKKQYIYYGEISREIGVSDPRALAKPLGRLSRECIELGLPAISAIVVKKDNQMPGDGFYEYVARLKGIGDLPPSKWEEFWRNEVAEVLECKSSSRQGVVAACDNWVKSIRGGRAYVGLPKDSANAC